MKDRRQRDVCQTNTKGMKDKSQEDFMKQTTHRYQPRQVRESQGLPNLDTGLPIPQEVDAVALSNAFELENPERDDRPDRASIPLQLGHHANLIASCPRCDAVQSESSIRRQQACSKDGPTELDALE